MLRISNAPAAATAERPHRMLMVCGGTNIGLEREQNQDTFVVIDLESGRMSRPCIRTDVWFSQPGLLMLVCDGMGGPAAGDVAAQMAAEFIKHALEQEGKNVGHAPIASLKRAVLGANTAIRDQARANPEERGMGTTCTAALVSPHRLAIAQVGDSRAYLLRGGRLHTLTRDQTVAFDLVDAGTLQRDEVEASPYRNVLVQALGTSAKVEPVITDVALLERDRVLLCSDGLHGTVSDEAIGAIMMGTPDVAEVSQALIAAALVAGGPDNVTVVVADCGPLRGKIMTGAAASGERAPSAKDA